MAWAHRRPPASVTELEFLNVDQVMEELALSRWVVIRLIRTGELPAQRLPSRRLQIERGMFERWIRDQYAATRLWLLENPNERLSHADWNDWPAGARR